MFALIALSDTVAAEREKAIAFLDEANALAEEVPQFASRSSAYVEIARRFAKFEESDRLKAVVKKSLETIIAIKDESTRAASLAELSALADELGLTVQDEDREMLRTIILRTMQKSF
jgi:hypothetical protein